jgi:DNA-binding CsgD family transcriptional regulator
MDGLRIRTSANETPVVRQPPERAEEPGAPDPAAVLEQVKLGIIVVDPEGRVLSANGPAQRLLDGRGEFRVEAGGLKASHARENELLHRLIAEVSQGAVQGVLRSAGAVSVRKADGRATLEVLVAPLREEQATGGLERATAVIYIIESALAPNPRQRSFAGVHGLTPAEARVASLITEGHTCRQAAQLLGVSHHTVRTQLKQIFFKTGVRRQAGLVRLMLSFGTVAG